MCTLNIQICPIFACILIRMDGMSESPKPKKRKAAERLSPASAVPEDTISPESQQFDPTKEVDNVTGIVAGRRKLARARHEKRISSGSRYEHVVRSQRGAAAEPQTHIQPDAEPSLQEADKAATFKPLIEKASNDGTPMSEAPVPEAVQDAETDAGTVEDLVQPVENPGPLSQRIETSMPDSTFEPYEYTSEPSFSDDTYSSGYEEKPEKKPGVIARFVNALIDIWQNRKKNRD